MIPVARMLAVVALIAPASHAQTVTLKPLADARLRYEHVEQDGIADRAYAVTLRVRSIVKVAIGPWSALVEAEGTIAIDPHYNEGYSRAGR